MTLPPQISLARSLQERGRKAVRTKREAENALAKLHKDLRELDFPEMDSSAAERMVGEAEQAYNEGRYQDALDLANAGRRELDMAGQEVMTSRFMELRETVELGFSYTPPELLDRIVEGELAMSKDISEAAMIAESLKEEARLFILDSIPALQAVVDEVIKEEDVTPELRQAMQDLQQAEGDLEDVRRALRGAIDEIEKVYDSVAQGVSEQQSMVERALQDMGPISGMWDQSKASLRRGDYRQAFDTLYRIYDELDEILRQGIDYAREFINYRQNVLGKHGMADEELESRLEEMRATMEEDPQKALEIFLELDDEVGARESEMVSGIIDDLSEMIQIGRRVGHDIGPVIVGLDEARQILSSGDLDGALEKIGEVESVLREMMPGFIEMRESFSELERLGYELDEMDIDMDDADKRIEWGREMALRGDFDGAHEMIQEALGMIKAQALDVIADEFLECQIGLLSGFRMEAELPEEAESLDRLFQEVSEGRFKGQIEAARGLAQRIRRRLGEKAAESVEALRGDIDAHRGQIEVRPYEEMLAEAEAMIERGEHEQAHVHVWTARKKISSQVMDSLERHVRKIKDLVATGEYVNVDVSAYRREMYSLSTVGRRIRLDDVDRAKDLESRLAEAISSRLQQRVEELHNSASRHSAEGLNLDEQLSKLKSARRHLRSGDLRRGHELSREAKIELEIATILHGEVYSNMLRLDRIIDEEEDRRALEDALVLLHEGKFREADISTKRLLRNIMERGSRAAAAEMLSLGSQIEDAVKELGIEVVALRESVPQANFFIESEDYRLASSLMEKAVRSGRAEIASSLKGIVPQLRGTVEGVQFRPREEEAVKEMLSQAESIASGPEPERALDIITALRREAERRKELIDAVEQGLLRNRLSLGDAGRIGYEVGGQQELLADASELMAEGEFCLARGISERAVEQAAEIVGVYIRLCMERAMEDDELAGPDLERDLGAMEAVRRLVSERRFHAAGDLQGVIDSAKGRTSHKRGMVDTALRSLSELRDSMLDEGMRVDRVEAAMEQVEEWAARGTFISAYVLAQSHHINLNASLDAYLRIKPRIQRFRQMVDEAPGQWAMRSYIETLDEAVALISKGSSDDGVKTLLRLEDDAQRFMHERRQSERALIAEMAAFLSLSEMASDAEQASEAVEGDAGADDRLREAMEGVIDAVGRKGHDDGLALADDDHGLLELSALLKGRCEERLDSLLEAVEERGPAAELAADARRLKEEGAWQEAAWRARIAYCVQGLGQEQADSLVERFDGCLRRIMEAEAEGVDLSGHKGKLWSAEDPAGIIKACQMADLALDRIELSFLPRLDIELRGGYLHIRNPRPAMAVDLRIDGRPLADKLGMGEEAVYPVIKGRGFAEISYMPLLSETRRTLRVLI